MNMVITRAAAAKMRMMIRIFVRIWMGWEWLPVERMVSFVISASWFSLSMAVNEFLLIIRAYPSEWSDRSERSRWVETNRDGKWQSIKRESHSFSSTSNMLEWWLNESANRKLKYPPLVLDSIQSHRLLISTSCLSVSQLTLQTWFLIDFVCLSISMIIQTEDIHARIYSRGYERHWKRKYMMAMDKRDQWNVRSVWLFDCLNVLISLANWNANWTIKNWKRVVKDRHCFTWKKENAYQQNKNNDISDDHYKQKPYMFVIRSLIALLLPGVADVAISWTIETTLTIP